MISEVVIWVTFWSRGGGSFHKIFLSFSPRYSLEGQTKPPPTFPGKKEQGGTTDSKKTFFDFAPFFPTLPLSSSFCWSREKDTKSALHRVSLRDRVSFLLLFLMAGWDMDERLMAGTGKEKTLSVLGGVWDCVIKTLIVANRNFDDIRQVSPKEMGKTLDIKNGFGTGESYWKKGEGATTQGAFASDLFIQTRRKKKFGGSSRKFLWENCLPAPLFRRAA